MQERKEPEPDSSQRIWGVSPDTTPTPSNLLKARKFLLANFPECKQQINNAIACLPSRNTFELTSVDDCAKQNAELNYCIMHSYCPKEATAFKECLGSVPPVNGSRVRLRCLWKWRKLDKCMMSNTVEDEKE